jgi:hypothetical protein
MAKATKNVQAPVAASGHIDWTPNKEGYVNHDVVVFTSEDGQRALALAQQAYELERQAKEIMANLAMRATGKVWTISFNSTFSSRWKGNHTVGFRLSGQSAPKPTPNYTL